MAYLVDMPATCKARATNPEFALELLKSINGEFAKSFGGGIFDASYVLGKLEILTRHVKWLEDQAREQFAAECEHEGDPLPDELDDPDFYAPDGPMGGGA